MRCWLVCIMRKVCKYTCVINHPVSKRGILDARLKMQMQICNVVFELCQIVFAQLEKANET